MKCPRCNSEDTFVTASRSRDYNRKVQAFNVSMIPSDILKKDYRIRRFRCRTCGYLFTTVETYVGEELVEIV